MGCVSILLVKNHIPYLWDLSNSFSNSFIDFYSCGGFHQVIYQKEWSITLCIDNGSWHETLNLLHVSGCERLHFVMSYMKQNKSRKQTLESAQYGLEISFKPSRYMYILRVANTYEIIPRLVCFGGFNQIFQQASLTWSHGRAHIQNMDRGPWTNPCTWSNWTTIWTRSMDQP